MKSRIGVVGRIVLVPISIAILALIVMVLWNAVMPSIFAGTSRIDFWLALGLLVLSRVLFAGFSGRVGRNRGWQRRRWKTMTPEERARFRESAQDPQAWKKEL